VAGGPTEGEVLLERIRAQTSAKEIEFTLHARQEMAAEAISPDDVVAAIGRGQVLKNYPNDPRGASCLLSGLTAGLRPLHIVCASRPRRLIIITVYEPKPPKWPTPSQRRRP
jgi:hypothetical protein